jgi:hypothetical protein
MAFANRDRDSPPQLDPGEHVLMIQPRSEHVVVRANRNAVTYWPVALAGTTASFVFCDARGTSAARAIIVSQTGRPRVVVAMQRESRCAVSEKCRATAIGSSAGVKSNHSDAGAPFVGCRHPPIGSGTRLARRPI